MNEKPITFPVPSYTQAQKFEAFEYLRELALAPNAAPELACAVFSWEELSKLHKDF